jgi:hypothetical protein
MPKAKEKKETKPIPRHLKREILMETGKESIKELAQQYQLEPAQIRKFREEILADFNDHAKEAARTVIRELAHKYNQDAKAICDVLSDHGINILMDGTNPAILAEYVTRTSPCLSSKIKEMAAVWDADPSCITEIVGLYFHPLTRLEFKNITVEEAMKRFDDDDGDELAQQPSYESTR